MILVDNINFLRENYPLIREKLLVAEEKQDKEFFIENGKKGDKTLLYTKDGKSVYFHSKYNPVKEAESIIKEYQGTTGKNIIFYGTGLGYHIELFVRENPDNNFYIFEPIEELMEKFLSIRNLSKSEYKNLKGITVGLNEIDADIKAFLDLNRKETIIIELPVHKQTFAEEYQKFSETFLDVTRTQRSQLATNYSFQERWIINSMINLKDVLVTPNILLEKKEEFKGIPAILVAAGPSLNEEIENIRYIKEHKLAYILSVGSAINTLLHHNIFPHAATTYDPTKANERVFAKLKERGITEIPLIFGSSVAFEVLHNYPGKRYHMITSQDTIAKYYLATEANEIDIVFDAPSIAVVTLQLVAALGFNPIVLTGQNLAFVGQKRHSEGVSYSKELSKAEAERALQIEDVHGNQILTDDGFNRMRTQMEQYIGGLEKGRVINTTKGGAKIKGTEFRELKDILDRDLSEAVVVENWLEGDKTNYSKELLQGKAKAMDGALEESYKWMEEYKANLYKMLELVRNRNFRQLDIMYNKLNISIRALEANDFFTTFILPINRVQHKLLADTVEIVKREKNIYKKHLGLLTAYQNFMEKCGKDIERIRPIYEKMKQEISSFKNNLSL